MTEERRVKIKRDLIIVGCGEFGSLARSYFEKYTEYRVIAFAVERDFLGVRVVDGVSVVPSEEIELRFPPGSAEVFVAITYTKLNRSRNRLVSEAEAKGYTLTNFISPFAFVSTDVQLGKNVFVFEHNVIQRGATIGDSSILWSGNHVGHHARVSNGCYISSHVVISGYTQIGKNCFLGVNSCFADNIKIGDDCIIGMGSVVTKDCEQNSVYHGNPAVRSKVSAKRFSRVED